MALSPSPASAVLLLLALFLFLLSSTTITIAASSSSILSELSALQSQSPAGVVHLSDDLLRRVVAVPVPRPFHALVFFDAKQLHSKPELALPTLKSEFALLSKSFHANNPDKRSKLFFFTIEFQESQASFQLFGINSLPHILLIPPSAVDLKSESIQMDASAYSGLADSMSEFVQSRTGLSVGPIQRPPLLSNKQIGLIIIIFLISTPYFIKKLISGNTLFHDKHVWMAGAVFVYFFSVSGAMFNIIRKMPMFLVDRNDPSKLVFFYQGSGMQLGAEGFTIGFLYTVVGLLIALVTNMLVKIKQRNVQRMLMIVAMFMSFLAVKRVVYLDNWKTGYGIHGYWPSSWR